MYLHDMTTPFSECLPILSLKMKSADIDEKAIRKEKPEELVVALAEAKVRFHLAIHLCYTIFCDWNITEYVIGHRL